MQFRGKAHGAFTFHLIDALRDAETDRDGDGRISILEATIESRAPHSPTG